MLGDRIRKIREKRQLTQRELGALCGLGDKQIWRYENGLSEPTADALARMARVLGVAADYILGLVDNPDEHLTEESLSPMERKLIMAVRQGLIVEALESITAITKSQDQPVITPGEPAVDS